MKLFKQNCPWEDASFPLSMKARWILFQTFYFILSYQYKLHSCFPKFPQMSVKKFLTLAVDAFYLIAFFNFIKGHKLIRYSFLYSFLNKFQLTFSQKKVRNSNSFPSFSPRLSFNQNPFKRSSFIWKHFLQVFDDMDRICQFL